MRTHHTQPEPLSAVRQRIEQYPRGSRLRAIVAETARRKALSDAIAAKYGRG